jgi:hypothetical protein
MQVGMEPREDGRPVMQDFQLEARVGEPLTDMSQFPADKAGLLRAEFGEFKLIRRRSSSGGYRSTAAFAVHH